MEKTIVINNELDGALKQRFEAESRAMIKLLSEMKRVVEAKETKAKEEQGSIKQDAPLTQCYDDRRNWAKYFV